MDWLLIVIIYFGNSTNIEQFEFATKELCNGAGITLTASQIKPKLIYSAITFICAKTGRNSLAPINVDVEIIEN